MIDTSLVVVLYRQPDSMCLWGIPYRMREGQQPRDLYEAWRDYEPPPPGAYGSRRIDISDWQWLGQPGWWGSLTMPEREEIERFVKDVGEALPRGPGEWSVVPRCGGCRRVTEFIRLSEEGGEVPALCAPCSREKARLDALGEEGEAV